MMEIDGYTPVSRDAALSRGVSFVYPVANLSGEPVGKITIRARTLNMRLNPAFALKFKAHLETAGRDDDSAAAERAFLGLLHDVAVIAWETDIKSKGEPITPTRENFIALLTSEVCQVQTYRTAAGEVIGITNAFYRDATDVKHFRDLEGDEKNSDAPSGG